MRTVFNFFSRIIYANRFFTFRKLYRQETTYRIGIAQNRSVYFLLLNTIYRAASDYICIFIPGIVTLYLARIRTGVMKIFYDPHLLLTGNVFSELHWCLEEWLNLFQSIKYRLDFRHRFLWYKG